MGNYSRQKITNMKLSLLASEIIPILGKPFSTFSLLLCWFDVLRWKTDILRDPAIVKYTV